MKKYFIILCMLCSLSLESNAQDVFNMYLKDAKAIVNNPKSNPILARIAQFKCAELEYISEQAFKDKEEVETSFLDNQAYYMNEFINSFIKEVLVNTSLSNKEKKSKILMYMDASVSNPLFKDEDKEFVNSYIDDSKNQYTPFCLDTDWIKAYAAVQSQLKAENK